jgi:integrase
VFRAWSAAQPPSAAKLCDEWGVAVRRFVELFGDVHVAAIDGDMVADFRDAMFRLPSRPEHEIRALPLLDQIELADRDGLRRLSGQTVTKLVSGIRVMLGYACDPLRIIRANAASGVKVLGAKSADDARLAFDDDDMAQIFSHPKIVDPRSSFTDAEFWLQVLAPLTGLRIEEMGKLRPENVRCERGIWYIAIERDRAARRHRAAADGEIEKRAKTQASYRHVPLHWILIEAGFVEFAQQRAAAGSDWLLAELEADQYGNRTKAASRRIIRHFRAMGITDEEKVFYSFRHTMKRECRRRPMKEEIADLLAGHAPATIGRKYGAGAALPTLKEAVDMIDYETVDWDAVVRAGKLRITCGRQ